MSTQPPETMRRIEEATLIAAGTPNSIKELVRAHLGGGS